MGFFFQRTFPQELLHILLSDQRTIGLLAKFRLMAFLRSLHAAKWRYLRRRLYSTSDSIAARSCLREQEALPPDLATSAPSVARAAPPPRPCATKCLYVFHPVPARPNPDRFAPSQLRPANCA